ncbi:MAG: 5'-nucleotidase C-terminal domain-containing protein [Firmicutes bacterium]|nr:5'-nucleotidase C-terminal domain-containing protein [Bacillota bacterium]
MGSREFWIVQQNDTHGYLSAHPELFWSVPSPSYHPRVGGWAKIRRAVQELRSKGPVLFVDGGDTFHGTGPVVLSQGQIIPPLLRTLGVDILVPGNWDFAYGPTALKDLLTRSGATALAANVSGPGGEEMFPGSHVLEVGGVVLGLIGLTYSAEAETMPSNFVGNLTFHLDLQHITRSVERLRHDQQVDLVVVISHLGLPSDLKLAQEVSGIDVILSAHTHDRLYSPMMVGNTVVMQSGAHSSFLGILRVRVNEAKRIEDVEHRLMTLSDEADDAEMTHEIEVMVKPFQEHLSTPVGQLGSPLHRMTVLEAPMDRLITDAYLEYTEADIAFSHGWRYGAPILPGTVTQSDLYGMIPTNPQLFETAWDGDTLRQFLEKNLESVFAANPFEQKGGYVVRSSGLLMAFKPYNPKGHRIEYLAVNNREVTAHSRYRVVSAGPQGLRGVNTPRHDLGVSAHDVIRAYFRRHKPVVVSEAPHVIAL